MQFKKTEIENAIVKAAREEFLAKGFNDASIRTITRNAGVARSNLYNYFATKDALFTAVVQPTLTEIKQALQVAWEMMSRNGGQITSFEQELAEGRILVEFIDAHREDLTLILLKSSGSSVEEFREYVQAEYQKIHACYFETLKAQFPSQSTAGASPFFIHALSVWALDVVTEMVAHEIPLHEMLNHTEQFVRFYYHGLLGLMQP